jgi:hypothetical protein
MIAHQEQASLATRLIRETIDKQNVPESQLTIHSDRDPSMTSHSVAQLMASLGVIACCKAAGLERGVLSQHEFRKPLQSLELA